MTLDWEHAGNADPLAAARRKRAWRIAGFIIAVVVATVGLAFVAVAVLFVVAVNSYGSNK